MTKSPLFSIARNTLRRTSAGTWCRTSLWLESGGRNYAPPLHGLGGDVCREILRATRRLKDADAADLRHHGRGCEPCHDRIGELFHQRPPDAGWRGDIKPERGV